MSYEIAGPRIGSPRSIVMLQPRPVPTVVLRAYWNQRDQIKQQIRRIPGLPKDRLVEGQIMIQHPRPYPRARPAQTLLPAERKTAAMRRIAGLGPFLFLQHSSFHSGFYFLLDIRPDAVESLMEPAADEPKHVRIFVDEGLEKSVVHLVEESGTVYRAEVFEWRCRSPVNVGELESTTENPTPHPPT